jgi:hypothetical protein
MRGKMISPTELTVPMLAYVISGASQRYDCNSTSQSAGMKEKNEMKDNSVSLTYEELVKQLLSDRHVGITGSLVA